MNKYRTIFTNSHGWRQYQTATLGVSITSPNWQGDKLASILDFCSSRFTSLCIDVTDALYRHNFMAEGSQPNLALRQANALGDLWLAQHQDMISSCPIPYKIIRWAEWYEHPDYEKTLKDFHSLYTSNQAFFEAVEEDVKGFCHRQERQYNDNLAQHSRDFLLEETAVLTLQTRDFPSVKIYPGDELNCLRVVRTGLIPDAPKGLELGLFGKVKFQTRNAFKVSKPNLSYAPQVA